MSLFPRHENLIRSIDVTGIHKAILFFFILLTFVFCSIAQAGIYVQFETDQGSLVSG